ncbi:uncharacterized protein LOC132731773 [Ruditapes philippinarum]|uniref:uncharacterized protein LOC132731773 n=1 Tax=Ruditapes philippinarum TaxID=129788 RepID=UPI00295B42E8|nr:uncharacterized protein LOC132731773 [Ruditapes philippinarum]XP_060574011.1 uncharacterized protein LOC132731773 [Ruditapes philippinarum]
MYQVPNYTETVSMKLSEVLADIGVDERIVMKRRRTLLLMESIENIYHQLLDENFFIYLFGSQSEGTTTIGIQSDIDQLIRDKEYPVIQDWSDWISGLYNFLMIQDNSVSPGHCLLQSLRSDAPLPADGESDQFFFKDRTGRVFVKNSIVHVSSVNRDEVELHGPAYARQGQPGYCDKDTVMALHCTTWPQQARQWLIQQGEGQWPSAEMKQYCSRTGCFVVTVGCSGSEHEQLEWRISTSLAERCLMFNLNITQIRCYVLMKILKRFINPLFNDVITSFMCKTVLFHCIANTHSNIWRENNLLLCLSLCLYLLYTNIIYENCPHFIIPGNNLMRGKISPAVKPYILEKLNIIINSEGLALLGIKCDDLGSRLLLKLSAIKKGDIISGKLLYNLAFSISGTLNKTYHHLKKRSPNEAVEILKNFISKTFNSQYEGLDKTASHLMLPWYCTILGSFMATLNIYHYNTVSADALKLIALGLNTDVASSKLKLASILFCVQEIQKVDLVLSEIEKRYDLQIVEPICKCHVEIKKELQRQGFLELCDNHNEEILKYTTASCVRFLPCEIHCVPTELRYEMFRSTQEDRIFRTKEDNMWMDCAVVDSLPYLYFLQYKVYSHLGRRDQKQAALFKLIRTIKEELNLGHRETALNLLGKCMEQEGRAGDALQCYFKSLNVRGRDNAAKIHINAL